MTNDKVREALEFLTTRADVSLKQRIANAIISLHEALALNPWQPIETAPKDEEIIGWGHCEGEINGRYTSPSRAIIKWDNYNKQWDVCNTDTYGVIMKPTHWQPLPNPPEKK